MSLVVSLFLFLICVFSLSSFIGSASGLSVVLICFFNNQHFVWLVSIAFLFSTSLLFFLTLFFPSLCFLFLCCSFLIFKMGTQCIYIFIFILLFCCCCKNLRLWIFCDHQFNCTLLSLHFITTLLKKFCNQNFSTLSQELFNKELKIFQWGF